MSGPRPDGVIDLHAASRLRPRARPPHSSPPAEADRPEALLWHPDAAHEHGEKPLTPLPLVVRAVRPRDVVSLARVPLVLLFNQPEVFLAQYRPARLAAGRILPWRRPRARIFVASAGERLVGFAHWESVLPDRRWQLVALGAATGVYDASPVWEELIRHGVTAAGLRGVKRLYARVPLGSAAEEPIRALGFAPYASETIFVAHDVRTGPTTARPREQEQTDTWAVHQLYISAAPKQVQYAEAWTSHRWDVRGGEAKGVTTRGWLIEDGRQLLGYARVTSRGATHILEVIGAPDHRAVVPELIDAVIARLRSHGRVGRIYCALRGYQGELVAALEERGFDPFVEQDLSIKYTTATARAPQTEPVVFHADLVERLPKRVPSFLQGKAGDGAAR